MCSVSFPLGKFFKLYVQTPSFAIRPEENVLNFNKIPDLLSMLENLLRCHHHLPLLLLCRKLLNIVISS